MSERFVQVHLVEPHAQGPLGSGPDWTGVMGRLGRVGPPGGQRWAAICDPKVPLGSDRYHAGTGEPHVVTCEKCRAILTERGVKLTLGDEPAAEKPRVPLGG